MSLIYLRAAPNAAAELVEADDAGSDVRVTALSKAVLARLLADAAVLYFKTPELGHDDRA